MDVGTNLVSLFLASSSSSFVPWPVLDYVVQCVLVGFPPLVEVREVEEVP